MVLVYLVTGECVEIPEAMTCERDGDTLRCLDASGVVVRTFASREVSVFTNDPEVAELVREEMCEDDEKEEASVSSL